MANDKTEKNWGGLWVFRGACVCVCVRGGMSGCVCLCVENGGGGGEGGGGVHSFRSNIFSRSDMDVFLCG